MRVLVLCDTYPEVSETFITAEVRGLARAGLEVRVESLAHAGRPAEGAPPAIYWEDDGTARRVRDLLWLLARRPGACLLDLLGRRRWRREDEPWPLRALAPAARRLARGGEAHVHAHFAAGAALCALRLSRLSGATWSFTAHGYDIFQRPRNLALKLRTADFATSGSAYTVGHLRAAAPDAVVHEIVMGIDPGLWAVAPAPGGRHVVSVGRLVEKKGFADLIAAAARLRDRGEGLDRLTIVGEGPLRAELEALVERLGLRDVVELPGAQQQSELPALLARCDVFCLPCVVAADGDRDSMPVVVKEALAAGRPVVATDEVGLPEVVQDAWGRLVPPHDPEALAGALAEVLALPVAEREAMGRAGRTYVAEHADVWAESARLADLIRAAAR